jgi:uncharacterized membrane protein YkgB
MKWDSQVQERRLAALGGAVLRYSLVLFFLAFGLLKFTHDEAVAIQPVGSHSPVLFWLYGLLDMQTASDVIGVIEIALALAMASRHISPRLSALGSLGTAFALATTLSFLFTTPHLDPAFRDFIIKDLTLLGAAIWTASEALAAARARPARRAALA